jgi:multidrug efflux pump subunit AcrB
MQASSSITPDSLEAAVVTTPIGGAVRLGELAKVERTVGPSTIYRVEGRRTASVQFSNPGDYALKEALDIIRAEVEPDVQALLPEDGSVVYGGSADDLERAIRTMGTNFLVAIGILFVLTAVLFKSPRDAGFVIITIPLAAAGGILALRLLDAISSQYLDLLTMIGFTILLGLVVNNAILLVARTRQAEADGLDRRTATREALRTRLRPIFMSTLTSLLGMMPLVVMPGVGSEIYRGMAAVIVGGMAMNAAFTLVLIPSLLRLGEARRRGLEEPSSTSNHEPTLAPAE